MGGEMQEHHTERQPPTPPPGGPRVFETWEGNDVSENPRIHLFTFFPESSSPRAHSLSPRITLGRQISNKIFVLNPSSTSPQKNKQKFFCDGRIMTGPSPQNLAGTALVVFVPSVIFNIFVVRMRYRHFSSSRSFIHPRPALRRQSFALPPFFRLLVLSALA